MLNDKKILYLGTTPWAESTEQQFIFEKMASANLAIWVNPFGKINDSLLPKITRLNGELTVYYPGMNFLGLPFLSGFNERRRYLQVLLYLIEREFEPDFVWIDDPLAVSSARHFKNKGAKIIYFACPGKKVDLTGSFPAKFDTHIDYFITSDQKLFKKFNKHVKVHLLNGEEKLSDAEKKLLDSSDGWKHLEQFDREDVSEDLLENTFIKLIAYNCEELERIITER